MTENEDQAARLKRLAQQVRRLRMLLLSTGAALIGIIILCVTYFVLHTLGQPIADLAVPMKPQVSPRPTFRLLDGQVFIVTQGAVNVPLGLVQVGLLDLGEVHDSLMRAESTAPVEKRRLWPLVEAARVEFVRKNAGVEAAEKKPTRTRWRPRPPTRSVASAKVLALDPGVMCYAEL